MLKLPPNYVQESDCVDMLINHVKNYIIYYYRDNKLLEQNIDIRIGSNFLKIVYNHHHYFVTIVKINNVFHYYLQLLKNQHIVLIATSEKIFDSVINAIYEHDKLINR